MNRVPWPDDIDPHGGLATWLVNVMDDPYTGDLDRGPNQHGWITGSARTQSPHP
jgi:hypothetical protein